MSITISKCLGFGDGRQLPFVSSFNHGGALKTRFIVISPGAWVGA
jgi:hypothetical protein